MHVPLEPETECPFAVGMQGETAEDRWMRAYRKFQQFRLDNSLSVSHFFERKYPCCRACSDLSRYDAIVFDCSYQRQWHIHVMLSGLLQQHDFPNTSNERCRNECMGKGNTEIRQKNRFCLPCGSDYDRQILQSSCRQAPRTSLPQLAATPQTKTRQKFRF